MRVASFNVGGWWVSIRFARTMWGYPLGYHWHRGPRGVHLLVPGLSFWCLRNEAA